MNSSTAFRSRPECVSPQPMNNAPYAITPSHLQGEAFHPARNPTRPPRMTPVVSAVLPYSGSMRALAAGSTAPPIEGIDFGTGPMALFFYKVTCPVCQMAAPKVQGFESAYPGHVTLRSEEHTSELQSRRDLVCRLLLEKKK